MPLTEAQRVELERRGYPVTGSAAVVGGILVDLEEACDLGLLAAYTEVAAILGIAPPGYRLVPENTAQEWLAARREAIAGTDDSDQAMTNHVRWDEAELALASALSPKEVEPRG